MGYPRGRGVVRVFDGTRPMPLQTRQVNCPGPLQDLQSVSRPALRLRRGTIPFPFSDSIRKAQCRVFPARLRERMNACHSGSSSASVR